MTAVHDPRDPLTSDERALAALLDAPSTGPSAAIDARILATARAAASVTAATSVTSAPATALGAERRHHHGRRRGLQWIRVGGVAASLVLVLGLGWRLALEAPGRGVAADSSDTAAEATGAQSVVSPEPVGSAADAPDASAEGVAAADSAAAEPAAEEAATMTKPAAQAFKAGAPPPPSSPEAGVMESAQPPVAVASPAAAPPPSGRAATGDSALRARALASERAAGAASAPVADDAASARDPLERIEVTGSRIRMVDIGIADDARLPIADWFDRIRQRRDEGDLDGARGSLGRFRAQHPRVAVPVDLQALDVGSR